METRPAVMSVRAGGSKSDAWFAGIVTCPAAVALNWSTGFGLCLTRQSRLKGPDADGARAAVLCRRAGTRVPSTSDSEREPVVALRLTRLECLD